MTPPALAWLRSLARAVSVRHLYAADHPLVDDAVADLMTQSVAAIGGQLEAAVSVVDGRLTCNDLFVPGCDVAAARIFDQIRAAGYDRVTLRHGLTVAELRDLVGGLAGRAASLASSAHIRFSVLEITSDTSAERPGLLKVWQGIADDRVLDVQALDTILTPISRAAASPSDVLPLAALRRHDEYTATHISNVAVLTSALARAVGLPAAAVREIAIAALLHDIGKMRIPGDVLNHPGRLSGDQLALMHRHPEIGARMLLQAAGVPPIAVVVAYEHHLQADGGGYPDVPRGWTVSGASAMTHIADVYDALRTHRPYRAALSHDEVVVLMRRDRRSVFQADLLDVFLEEVAPRAAGAALPPAPPGLETRTPMA